MDDLHFGVHQDMMYAMATPPVPGAQWTGIVTQIACQMLESGAVEAVVCVQSDEHDRFTPKPVIAQRYTGHALEHACARAVISGADLQEAPLEVFRHCTKLCLPKRFKGLSKALSRLCVTSTSHLLCRWWHAARRTSSKRGA